MKKIDFFIAGASKSATTSLLNVLKMHPGIYGHDHPEFSFFLTKEYSKGMDFAYKKYFPEPQGCRKLLAKHVLLMYSKEGQKKLLQEFPTVKIILVFRDPVQRAYSQYHYSRSLGREPINNFKKALIAENQRLEEDGWYRWKNNAYLYNSMYNLHLEILYSHISPDNIYPYVLENYENISELADKIIDDLGLSKYAFPIKNLKINRTKKARSVYMAYAINKMIRNENLLKKFVRNTLPNKLLLKLRIGISNLNLKSTDENELREDEKDFLKTRLRSVKTDLNRKYDLDTSKWV